MLEIIAQAEAPASGNPLSVFLPFILIMGAMWFLMIAPQRKRQKEHQKMLEALKPGDEIITSGGIFGTVQQVRSDRLVVKIADNTRIEIGKAFVSTKVQPKTETNK